MTPPRSNSFQFGAIKRMHLIFVAALLVASVCVAALWYLLDLVFVWREASLFWLLAAGPLSVALAWYAAYRNAITDNAIGGLLRAQQLVTRRSSFWAGVRLMTFALGLTFLVLALIGPRYGTRTEMLQKRGVDLVIALDLSKSMLARDVKPSRFKRAKLEIADFLNRLGGDRVGLVAFAGDTIAYPMTDDYAATNLFLRDLSPNDMPVGGTAIGRALVAAGELLERSRTKKSEKAAQVIVLFTDGEDHEGDPIEIANELGQKGVRIYTVGIGSRKAEPIPTYTSDNTWAGYLKDNDGKLVTTSLSKSNEEALKKMAEAGKGRYFAAGKGRVGVDRVAKAISTLQQSEREARKVTVHEDRYALFLLPALFFLMLEMVVFVFLILQRRAFGAWRDRRRHA